MSGKKSIIHNDDTCFLCRGRATDTHHCLFGNKRAAADKYGLTVRLCRKCHNMVHNPHTEAEQQAQDWLKKVAQEEFERQIGKRDQFLHEFGRNYL